MRYGVRLLALSILVYLFAFQSGSKFFIDTCSLLLNPERAELGDFYQYWAAAHDWQLGHSIYRDLPSTVGDHASRLGRPLGESEAVLAVNAYPPSSTLFFLPAGYLTCADAARAWRFILLAAYAATCLIVSCELFATTGRRALFGGSAMLVLLGSPWLWHDISLANVGGVVLFLVVAAWACDRHGYHRASGVLAGVAAALKLFPALLLVYYFLTNRRAAKAMAATVSLVVLTTLGVFGFSEWRTFAEKIAPGSEAWVCWRNNLSVFGFWHRLFTGMAGRTGHPDIVPLLRAPGLAVALSYGTFLLLGLLTAKVVRAQGRSSDLGFAACVVGMVLMNPLSWPNSLPLAAVGALPLLRTAVGDWRRELALSLLLLVLWVHPVVWWSRGHVPDTPYVFWQSATVLAVRTYALLVLFGWLFLAATARSSKNEPLKP